MLQPQPKPSTLSSLHYYTGDFMVSKWNMKLHVVQELPNVCSTQTIKFLTPPVVEHKMTPLADGTIMTVKYILPKADPTDVFNCG